MIVVEKDEIYVELHTAALCEENAVRKETLEYAIALLDSCMDYEIEDDMLSLELDVSDFPTEPESIKEELKELKIKQWEVARELHISEYTLIRWLRNINKSQISKIKEAVETILARRNNENRSVRQQ